LKSKSHSGYYLLLSVIAEFLLIIIFYFDASENVIIKPFNEKIFLFLGFIVACIIGLTSAWFPGWYKTLLNKKNIQSINTNNLTKKIKRKGHHPDCEKFYNHILTIRNNSYCTGCFGLSIGFIISIFLSTFYIIYRLQYPKFMLLIGFICGLILIEFVYLETIVNKNNRIIHIISNALLINSLFILIVTVYELTAKIQYGFIALLFSFLFIDTRIHLSKRKHKLICTDCANMCKMY